MPLRLVEIILPAPRGDDVRALVEEKGGEAVWTAGPPDGSVCLHVLLAAEQTEGFMDALEQRYAADEGFRVVLFPVEATLPRLDDTAEERTGDQETRDRPSERPSLRISREELYAEITDGITFTRVFVALVVLSSIVAAIGLLRDNVAVVIGAMVIAPLLGPNVGLALATTLGDFDLGRKALRTNVLGVSIALALAIAAGLVLDVDPTVGEIASRTEIHLSDVVLALASGSAGVLAVTTGVATALIGVMVAVALLPPLVVLGLLLGSGAYALALGALMLLLTNLICVNLAGVTTFLVQGVRPRTWWEATRAKKATRIAIGLWSFLLLVLVAVVYLSRVRGG